ncbi:MAG: hypothetical protein WCI12_09475 [Actinomycetes bacterium]
MQIGLLSRTLWTPRIELSNAIFELIEVSSHRRRSHSRIGLVSPIEFQLSSNTQTT